MSSTHCCSISRLGLGRGNHQGQRLRVPRKQAGHTSASDQCEITSNMSCYAGAIHTGPSLRMLIRSPQTMEAGVQSYPKSKFLALRGFGGFARPEGHFHLYLRREQMAGTGHHLIMWTLSVEFKYATENAAKACARICIKVEFLSLIHI